MGISLDFRTISLFSGVIYAVFGMVLFQYSRKHKGFVGISAIGYGFLLGSAGSLLLSLRHFISDFASIVIANSASYIGLLLIYRGLFRFLGVTLPWEKYVSTLFLCVLVFCLVFFTYVVPDVNARILAYSTCVAVLFAIPGYGLFRSWTQSRRHPVLLLAMTFLAIDLYFAYRIIWTLNAEPLFDFMTAGMIHSLGAVSTNLMLILIAFTVLWLVSETYSERMEAMVEDRTRELRSAQDELLVKERLAVLGHLAGSISHEIRNPLAVVDSSVYLMKRRTAGRDEKLNESIERVHNNVRKATDIIESLLNLTRMEPPKTKPHAMADLINDAIQSNAVPESVEVVRKIPEDRIWVEVDGQQIGMALKNMIMNALQAMEGEGTLILGGRVVDGRFVELTLSDTGPGIPSEKLDKVFEPLFTTKAQGIGFGLSITKMIVDKHGGTVWAESSPGAGTTFHMTLPMASGSPASE